MRIERGRDVTQVADLVRDHLGENGLASAGHGQSGRARLLVLVQLVGLDARLLVEHNAVALLALDLCASRRATYENVTGLYVQMDQIKRVHVRKALGYVQQQTLQIVLAHQQLGARGGAGLVVERGHLAQIVHFERLDELGKRAAIAVLVLDEHAVRLGPRRVILHNVVVFDEDGVGAHLFPRVHLGRRAGYGLFGPFDGVSAAIQPIDALEHVAELARAQFAHLVKLFVVPGDETLAERETLVGRRCASPLLNRVVGAGLLLHVAPFDALVEAGGGVVGQRQVGSGQPYHLGRVRRTRQFRVVVGVGRRERVDVGVQLLAEWRVRRLVQSTDRFEH
ncbi:hypothetical protein BpHYR1_020254 [Brachionus plicatilis]|uniref:Uncharacterized protein n=1 Tax=Brachionus plicatilis TaxID=10195 RepID=A0A3M7QJN6_BRAPC|nr:hypothetical protein BpHYR1_020254 [Brachionus plicatilis]